MRNDKSPSSKWWPRRDRGWSPEEKKRGKKKEIKRDRNTVDEKKNINWRKGRTAAARFDTNSAVPLHYHCIYLYRVDILRHETSDCIDEVSTTPFVACAWKGDREKCEKIKSRIVWDSRNARHKKEIRFEECRCKKWRRTSCSRREEVRVVCDLRRTEFTKLNWKL